MLSSHCQYKQAGTAQEAMKDTCAKKMSSHETNLIINLRHGGVLLLNAARHYKGLWNLFIYYPCEMECAV